MNPGLFENPADFVTRKVTISILKLPGMTTSGLNNNPPWRFCCLARGIPGVRFLPKTSPIWGRLRATRSVISIFGLA